MSSYERHMDVMSLLLIACATSLLTILLYLRINSVQSVFDFVVLVATVTPYSLIFRSITDNL